MFTSEGGVLDLNIIAKDYNTYQHLEYKRVYYLMYYELTIIRLC